MNLPPDAHTRLVRLGHRPRLLPGIEPCAHCESAEPLRIHLEIITGDYAVACECCGYTGDGHVMLRVAIERWNKAQREYQSRQEASIA